MGTRDFPRLIATNLPPFELTMNASLTLRLALPPPVNLYVDPVNPPARIRPLTVSTGEPRRNSAICLPAVRDWASYLYRCVFCPAGSCNRPCCLEPPIRD